MADFRLGTTFGFEIRIDYSWFFLFALILWSFSSNVFPFALPGLSRAAYLLMGAMAAILFFTSLLIHELSHALVARAKGIHVAGITLFIFGGVARTSREATTPGDEFQIAGAGPLTSFLLAGIFWGVTYFGATLGLDASVVTVAGYLAILNLVLAIFNLLPGFPLDGGRLLRAVLWRASGDMTKATRWATLAGQGVAWLLIALGAWQAAMGDVIGGMWLILIAWFLRNAAVASWRQHLIAERIEEARRMLEAARAEAGLEGGVEIDEEWRGREAGAKTDPFLIPIDRLPEGFARSIEAPSATPVDPVPAATVVLARDGEAGLEVLLLKRHKSSGFVPGAYVFPGGRVDPADADPAVLERVDGLPQPLRPDAAYWVAAVREAFEETGVLLGHRVEPDSAPALVLDEWRERLMSDETTLGGMLDALDLQLDLRRMIELAHWITPIAEPRRYDTRFFLAAPRGGAEARIDAREMTDALWLAPTEALRRFRAGTLPMVFPTVHTLEKLTEFRTATQALEALRGAAVPPYLPRLVRRGDGVTIELTES